MENNYKNIEQEPNLVSENTNFIGSVSEKQILFFVALHEIW